MNSNSNWSFCFTFWVLIIYSQPSSQCYFSKIYLTMLWLCLKSSQYSSLRVKLKSFNNLQGHMWTSFLLLLLLLTNLRIELQSDWCLKPGNMRKSCGRVSEKAKILCIYLYISIYIYIIFLHHQISLVVRNLKTCSIKIR